MHHITAQTLLFNKVGLLNKPTVNFNAIAESIFDLRQNALVRAQVEVILRVFHTESINLKHYRHSSDNLAGVLN